MISLTICHFSFQLSLQSLKSESSRTWRASFALKSQFQSFSFYAVILACSQNPLFISFSPSWSSFSSNMQNFYSDLLLFEGGQTIQGSCFNSVPFGSSCWPCLLTKAILNLLVGSPEFCVKLQQAMPILLPKSLLGFEKITCSVPSSLPSSPSLTS